MAFSLCLSRKRSFLAMGQTSSGSVSFGPSSHGLDVRLRWDKRRQRSLALSHGLDVRLRWDKRHQGPLALDPSDSWA